MTARRLGLGLWAAAVGLGVVATVSLLAPPAGTADWCQVELPDIDLGSVEQGTHVVAVRLHNRSVGPGVVAGAAQVCDGNVCHSIKLDSPLTIPPGGRAEVPVELITRVAGPFEATVTLYVHDRGLRPVSARVYGVCRPPRHTGP